MTTVDSTRHLRAGNNRRKILETLRIPCTLLQSEFLFRLRHRFVLGSSSRELPCHKLAAELSALGACNGALECAIITRLRLFAFRSIGLRRCTNDMASPSLELVIKLPGNCCAALQVFLSPINIKSLHFTNRMWGFSQLPIIPRHNDSCCEMAFALAKDCRQCNSSTAVFCDENRLIFSMSEPKTRASSLSRCWKIAASL